MTKTKNYQGVFSRLFWRLGKWHSFSYMRQLCSRKFASSISELEIYLSSGCQNSLLGDCHNNGLSDLFVKLLLQTLGSNGRKPSRVFHSHHASFVISIFKP